MTRTTLHARCVLITITLVFHLSALTAMAQTTGFTYQGRLTDGGAAANGTYDLQFKLFDTADVGTGTQQPQPNPVVATLTNVPVTAGIFTVQLDFGANAFPGASRFLEIGARPSGADSFTLLAPRQPITSTPYAVRSLNATNADSATNATAATTATNATQLGGVAASQYLLTNGNGSALTNLNAASITTGTLSTARLGQIATANLADNAVTGPKIAGGQVVKGITVSGTTLTDNVTLAAGSNITITPAGNMLTIASTAGGVGGSGTPGSIPFWASSALLGNSGMTVDINGIQMPNGVQLAAGAQGYSMAFGSPNGETGLSISTPNGPRADLRFDGTTVKLVARPAGSGPPAETNGITIKADTGNVGIGVANPLYRFQVSAGSPTAGAIYGTSSNTHGIIGNTTAGSGAVGVLGTNSSNGAGVSGSSVTGTGVIAFSTSGNLVEGVSSSNFTRRFHIDNNGTYFTGSDFAEALPVLGNKTLYQPGDVLVVSTKAVDKVEKSRRAYDTRVAGVYSTRPGIVGADKNGTTRMDANEVPVAILGIVPTKVTALNGRIRVGDLLTTSTTPGYAMRCTNRMRCVGATVGKALEPLDSGKGIIKALVMLR